MESVKPLLELLVLLIVFSAVVERLTELWKLRNKDGGLPKDKPLEEAGRVRAITWGSLVIGVFLGIAVKANLFEMMVLPDNVWQTLGWLRVDTDPWSPSAACANGWTIAYAAGGSLLGGVAFSLGSKFWHDILGIIEEYRRGMRNRPASKVAP